MLNVKYVTEKPFDLNSERKNKNESHKEKNNNK